MIKNRSQYASQTDNRSAGRVDGKTARNGRVLNVIAGCAWFILIAGIVCLFMLHVNERESGELTQELRQQYYSSNGQASPYENVKAGMGFDAMRLQPLSFDSVPPTPQPDAFISGSFRFDNLLGAEKTVQARFTELYNRNPDLVMWLETGDSISEPVVFRDNDYYMGRDFDRGLSLEGCVFLDEDNKSDLSDDVTLIYGHNMRNGHKFGNLDLYRDVNYYEQYPTITLHSIWEAEPTQYLIFSVFDASMSYSDPSFIDIRQFNFNTDEAKQQYIDALVERSLFKAPVEVDAQDQIVMLVTCSYFQTDGRLMVVGRKLREGESLDALNLSTVGRQ